MTSDLDQAIVAGLSAGDPVAWQALYDAHFDRIWRYVARVLGNRPSDVGDVVQETFLAAARSARNERPPRQTVTGWLYGIARNQVALFFRRRDHLPLPLVLSEQAEPLVSWLKGPAARPEDSLESSELNDLIRLALAQLWPGYAELLAGKYMEGRTIEQIASDGAQSCEAVRSKLARARRAFREVFERLTAVTQDVVKES